MKEEKGTIISTEPITAIKITWLCPECEEENVYYMEDIPDATHKVYLRCPECEEHFEVDLT